MNRRLTGIAATAVVLALSATACSSSKSSASGSSAAAGGAGKSAAKATTAADLGGMDALVAAAKKEGTLNVIALPKTWANYGAIMDAFTAKYGIKITDANPDGSSQDELNAIKQLAGKSSAPDVVDVGQAAATSGAAAGQFAPYQVATWSQIADAQKDSQGLWYNDYGGYIAIGYDADKVKNPPTTLKSLDDPQYKSQVALNGDPTKANAALSGVLAASLASGGSLDNAQPGIDYFAKLKSDGVFVPVAATQATIQSGTTPITIDWDYLQASAASDLKAKGVTWKVVVPSDGLFGGFYSQAISATAPHPAAARLWEEFLYSADGQNLWLKGMARPAELPALQKDGTADATALAALPAVTGTPQFATQDQMTAASKLVVAGWAKATG
ncbi:extracellular solute-binding protein [Catenulispora acidiphila DSM 44928]|uniref:Extracellular solute-binding protein n=1 Tax=Catenulispora acidiphila (strain DSM 44928 / JCM 14897 / NBRC 102108 / NRRL B-24433 / ID139908) TaxID=479433 RepID=C7Q7P8_CATAD|nr:ABC transporter substrate-binding protein [Catenulispora acidiphila]ACU72241.1 extracellular solute-binding protein [Catenulispora acidiphila DSM 44928]